jgi:predicted amidophosphoribosyltransferase
VQGSPALDRQILGRDEVFGKSRELAGLADIVCWIPQNLERSWMLGGSPAERVARQVGRIMAKPLVRALARGHRDRVLFKRQAELTREERLRNPIRFELAPEAIRLIGRRAALVDDFMTTGQTLKAAAGALRAGGAAEVHVFCLGLRPFRGASEPLARPEERRDLLEGAGRPVAVGQELQS